MSTSGIFQGDAASSQTAETSTSQSAAIYYRSYRCFSSNVSQVVIAGSSIGFGQSQVFVQREGTSLTGNSDFSTESRGHLLSSGSRTSVSGNGSSVLSFGVQQQAISASCAVDQSQSQIGDAYVGAVQPVVQLVASSRAAEQVLIQGINGLSTAQAAINTGVFSGLSKGSADISNVSIGLGGPVGQTGLLGRTTEVGQVQLLNLSSGNSHFLASPKICRIRLQAFRHWMAPVGTGLSPHPNCWGEAPMMGFVSISAL